jgi:histidine triad (HIT) family protein
MENCIFCKIGRGEIPSRKIHEEDDFVVFHDINPWAPVHFLLVPKEHIGSLQDVGEGHAPLLGRMMALVPRLALEQGCRPGPEGGFRVVINNGRDGAQEVPHLHIHVVGGPRPWLKG